MSTVNLSLFTKITDMNVVNGIPQEVHRNEVTMKLCAILSGCLCLSCRALTGSISAWLRHAHPAAELRNKRVHHKTPGCGASTK